MGSERRPHGRAALVGGVAGLVLVAAGVTATVIAIDRPADAAVLEQRAIAACQDGIRLEYGTDLDDAAADAVRFTVEPVDEAVWKVTAPVSPDHPLAAHGITALRCTAALEGDEMRVSFER